MLQALLLVMVVRAWFKSIILGTPTFNNAPFASVTEESDDTESDKRASDADEEESGQQKNGTDDAPKVENGVVATPPAPTPAEVDEHDSLDKLPPYFPAIQGCRSVEEFVCLNR